jgi:hypothetical protein
MKICSLHYTLKKQQVEMFFFLVLSHTTDETYGSLNFH